MVMEIKDGVEWKPWMVRRADFDGRTAMLLDIQVMAERCPNSSTRLGRYAVGVIEMWWPCAECGELIPSGEHATYHSLDEALAAFHEAEQKLIAGELQAV